MPIQNISERTRRLLKNGIPHVEDGGWCEEIREISGLIGHQPSDLLKIKGFGRGALTEVIYEAARNGVVPDTNGTFRRFFEPTSTTTCPWCKHLISLKL